MRAVKLNSGTLRDRRQRLKLNRLIIQYLRSMVPGQRLTVRGMVTINSQVGKIDVSPRGTFVQLRFHQVTDGWKLLGRQNVNPWTGNMRIAFEQWLTPRDAYRVFLARMDKILYKELSNVS